MKIKKVRVVLLKKKLSSSMTISRGGFTERHHALLEIETDSGLKGLGEGIGNAHYVKALVEAILASSHREKLIGQEAFHINRIIHDLSQMHVYFERQGSFASLLAAVEMALYDIKGQALGVPVCDLLGGQSQTQLDCYVSDIYWEENPEKMGDRAKELLDQGFTGLKAHIGYRGPKEDTVRVKALRRALDQYGGGKLMIDLNCGYDFHQYQEAENRWAEFDLFWLEEPMAPQAMLELGKTDYRPKIPLALGENEFGLQGFKRLLEDRKISVAMPDVGRSAGLRETMAICDLASVYGVKVSPHNFSSGVLLAATIQVMASHPHCELLEYDASQNAVIHELFLAPLKQEAGKIQVPRTPGLGVTLTEDIIQRFS